MRQPDASCCDPDLEAAGATGLEADFLEYLKSASLNELNARVAGLTPQERKILDFIVRGHCNKEICKSLGIEITTAKAHTSRIFKKLGVKNRVQAAVMRLWAILLTSQSQTNEGREVCPAGAALPIETRPGANLAGVRLLQRETR